MSSTSRRSPRHVFAPAVLASLALGLAACSGGGTGGGGSSAGPSTPSTVGDEASISVATAFYPLAWVSEHVGGDRVTITDLTPPGSDEHDLELSPATVDSLRRTDLVVYLADFQAAVDDAVAGLSGPAVYDVTPDANLMPRGSGGAAAHDDHAHDHAHDHDHAEDDHTEDTHTHAHGPNDPHFWLDPARLATVADGVARQLAAIDPAGADTYTANAQRVTAELTDLAGRIDTGLARCKNSSIVVTHQAYGYLTNPRGIEEIGIAGIDPDTEPSPARIAEIERAVQNSDATTVFGEVQVDQKVAEVIANQTGLKVDVLDPLGSKATADATYPGQMQKNLDALRAALDCP